MQTLIFPSFPNRSASPTRGPWMLSASRSPTRPGPSMRLCWRTTRGSPSQTRTTTPCLRSRTRCARTPRSTKSGLRMSMGELLVLVGPICNLVCLYVPMSVCLFVCHKLGYFVNTTTESPILSQSYQL